MQTDAASRTALTISLIRAHHSRTSTAPLVDDPWGDVLVPQSFLAALLEWATRGGARPAAGDRPQAVLDRYLAGTASYASVIFRARYAEDALAAAVAAGTRQYVQIGAGFDSYALRRPASAQEVEVFEVDHPATQNLKLERIAQRELGRPAKTQFIAADLSTESIGDALRRSTFRFDQPAFFSWLGVTIYLTREANLASMRAIAECCKRGSALVFTYTDELGLVPGAQSAAFDRMARNAASMGEPFLSGFDPKEMPALLAHVGFSLDEDLSGVEMSQRYGRPPVAPLAPSAWSRIALAHVAS